MSAAVATQHTAFFGPEAASQPSNATVPVLVHSFDPLPRSLSLSLSLSASSTVAEILHGFALGLSCFKHDAASTSILLARDFTVCHKGRTLAPITRLSSLAAPNVFPLMLEIRPLLRGGKGGFGSQLRAAGGKMSAGAKNANNDSCRDLNGRRLGVMKEAKKLASYLEGQEERKMQLDEAQKKKYAKLEKMLGRKPKGQNDFEEAARRMANAGESFDSGSASPEAGPSGSRQRVEQPATTAGSKRKERLDDPEYVEQSREIVENVRNAVASAMLKKKMAAAKNKPAVMAETTKATA